MEWADWNGSLLQWFGEQPLPYFDDEDDWAETAASVAGSAYFQPYNIPDPSTYDNWRPWAEEVTALINGRVRLEPN